MPIYPIDTFIPVIRTLNAVPDGVLITGIHCITNTQDQVDGRVEATQCLWEF